MKYHILRLCYKYCCAFFFVSLNVSNYTKVYKCSYGNNIIKFVYLSFQFKLDTSSHRDQNITSQISALLLYNLIDINLKYKETLTACNINFVIFS